ARVDVGEPTRLFSAPSAGAWEPTPTPVSPAPRPAIEHTELAPQPRQQPAFAAAAPAAPVRVPQPPEGAYATSPRAPGSLGRFFRALWDFTVTTVSLALFVGAWAAAVSGVAEGDRRLILGGAVATVLLTPLAVHRLTGRRGRYGFGVIGSVVATLGAVRAVGLDADPAIGLAAIFGLQIFACFVMAWLTKRKVREEAYV
ncbi:MAG TPA: hypothetical protein VEW03_09340, partial [Longimicrobiaceae bacterium]|nr:hypothetical protein [Longimicrobiaceae bacterium]